MRFHPLLSILSILLLATPVGAQQTFGLGTDITLPSFGPLGADHATVAVNHYGDSFVAYHSVFATQRHMVEGMAIAAVGGNQFQVSSSSHFALGNQSLNVLGEDSCIKPDVVDMPDGNFIVAWTRRDKTGANQARIEMCRIIMRDSVGALLPTPIVESPQAGVGYVIDPGFDATDSGGMVDLINLEDGTVAAVYAHQTSRVIDPLNGDTWREYDLRMVRVDWTLAPSDPGFIGAPIPLVSGIPFDNPGNRIPVGGQVLPDVVLDDQQHMVVAYEEFWLNGHGGVTANNLGRIVVKRFSGFQSAAPLSELNVDYFTRDPQRAQRRPNLATSRFDTRNSVSLSWGQDEVWFSTDKIVTRQITYQTSGSTIQNLYWANTALHQDTLPTSACGANALRFTFATREFGGINELIVARSVERDMHVIPTTAPHPLRPATALREYYTGGGGIGQHMYITYEGSSSHGASDYMVHLIIRKVP